jgi:hypothetical protein
MRKKAVVCFALWLISLAMLAVYRELQDMRSAETLEWSTAPGIIEHSSWSSTMDQDGHVSFFASVEYSYQVNGKSYKRSVVWPSLLTERKAEDVVNRYPKDRRLEVYYSPSDPSRSVLKRGTYPQDSPFFLEYVIVSIIISAAVGLPILVIAFWGEKRKS